MLDAFLPREMPSKSGFLYSLIENNGLVNLIIKYSDVSTDQQQELETQILEELLSSIDSFP